ncbi:unnamed protein product [Coccothraustes coccothraustes]
MRGTGMLLSVLAAPVRHSACGVPAQDALSILPILSVHVPPTAADKQGLDTPPAPPPRQAAGPATLLAAGRSGGGADPPPGAFPRPPPRLSRRLPRLAAVPGQDPPAPRPAAGGGKVGEDGRPHRLFRPGEIPSTLRRGSCFPSPSPLPGTPFDERRGPGRGRLSALEEPLGGEGLAAAAAWPGRRHHVSSGPPRGPRCATPSDCSADPGPGAEERWGGRPSGAQRGQLLSRPPRPPPPRREKPSAEQTWQTSPPAFPQLGGRVAVAKGSYRECPSSSLRPESRSAGREAGSARGAGCGHPGLPSHTHAARAAAQPGGETGRALPAPWTEMLPREEQTAGTRTRSAAAAPQAAGVPGTRCPRGTPGARDGSDRVREVVLEGLGMGRASPFAFGCSGTAERG